MGSPTPSRNFRRPGSARGRGFGLDDPLDRGEHALAHPFIEAAHIELNDGLVGNDVLLGASLKRTDGDHGGLGGGEFAGDDGLQAHDRRRRHHHRIDAGLRHRSMRAAPEQSVLQAAARGGNDPARPLMVPAGPTITCWPSTMSGLGKRSKSPSSIIAWAPSPVSSAGWSTAISVPYQVSRARASSVIAPTSQATCISWPQAGMHHRHRDLISGQLDLHRGQRIVEMVELSRADDRRGDHRLCQQPGERDLSARDATGFGNHGHPIDHLAARLFGFSEQPGDRLIVFGADAV